ncbi:MAG TPA: DUF2332 domain-containing protein [Acidimicrobiales bacterium]|jgi:hypothetical protein
MAPEDFERLPFYASLLRELEDDDAALRLLASVREEQRNPMLVLAALQLAGLRGHDVLAPIYDAARRGELDNPRQAAARVLSSLHDDPRIVSDELWRSTQTNEPGRSAVLQAVVRDLVSPDESINVVDVGASAGINLRFDQFVVSAEGDGDPLTLICDDLTPIERGALQVRVNRRIGIDPHPLSLENEDDRLWLKACLWAEERHRHERFDAIVRAAAHWPPITMLTGLVGDRLGDALAMCDDDTTTVVMNTWVAAYFSREERNWYYEYVTNACANKKVAWISMESPLIAWPGVESNVDSARLRSASQVVVTRPGSSPVRWGWCHAHGRWLERTSLA